jgi:succinoglycan biosynthesis protein ExoM
MHVTICIATHKRRVGLAKLLGSLAGQTGAPPFHVIVVDNDREKSAQSVVGQFHDKIPLTYLVEPVRGIARTRNRAVVAARSPFLAFIDDDEWATPRWLAELVRRQSKSAAEAVIGRVEVKFDAAVSEAVRHCGLFDTSPLPDGAMVPWYLTRTSNALILREALPDKEVPFSTRYDLSGGEDVHLFRTMISAGARVVASMSAVVFEHRSAERANLPWIFRRGLRNGVLIAELGQSATRDAKGSLRPLRQLQTATAALLRAGTMWNNAPSEAGRHVVKAGTEIGRLLHMLGVRIEEYRRHP